MSKTKKMRIVLISLLALTIGMIGFSIVKPMLKQDKDTIAIVQLSSDDKLETGDYLVTMNAVYQKALELTKDLNRSIDMFQNNEMSYLELSSMSANANKRLTYYYLMSLQTVPNEYSQDVHNEITYDFYLMRRSSEELTKYIQDKSDLRLNVARDLLSQTIVRENYINSLLAYDIAQYDIDVNTVVVDSSIWDKEYNFVNEMPELVVFKDLNSAEVDTYEYYLNNVNEGFMLVSWELQNIYLAKLDYEKGFISAEQLSDTLDKSGYVINNTYDNLYLLDAPEGLEKLERDTKNTITLYKDSLLELQKFSMSLDTEHFENAMSMINQADEKAGRIGEFIYSVRYQYRMDR